MNAKTTKYLAVLAVLAVAFAGCVVLFQEQGSDAAAGEAVTKETYATAYGTDKIFKSIKLETTADPKSVVLYTSGMEIVPGAAYFFADDADVSIPETVTLNLPVMFFILNGVEVDIVGPSKSITGTFGLIEFVNVKAYESGVITLDSNRTETATGTTLFASTGYAKALTTVTDEYTAADLKITYEKGDSFSIKADKTANPNKKFVVGEIDVLDAYGDMALAGNIETVNVKTSSTLSLYDFTGKIVSGTAVIEVENFAGKVAGSSNAIVVNAWTAGKITYTSASGVTYSTIELEQGNSISFAQGVKIPASTKFSFTRYVSDLYTFETTAITVGVGGFTIAAGTNGFELSGDVKATTDLTWTFEGAAILTGNIDATGKVIITGDGTYDVTLDSLTVFTTNMQLTNGAAVADNAVINVRSVLTVPAGQALKVGQGANIRVYKDTTGAGLELTSTSKIYTAGTIVADVIRTENATTIDDSEEKNLYGIAYVYGDGSITGSNVKFTRVNEARMAYIDLTGAGILGINGTTMVDNEYYKYSFIAFYPVESQDVFNLAADSRIVESIDAYASVISFEKNLPLMYAMYKIDYTQGIPSFDIVYKETYTVTLIDVNDKYTIKADNDTYNPVYIEDGTAQLVYGETYTLTGKTSSSKYTFTISDSKKQEISKTVTKFEQVRKAQTISVAEGKEQTITIELEQDDSPFKTGDALLQYYVDDENFGTVKLTTKDDKLIGTFKVYNTDLVLINLVDKKYFKFAASNQTNIEPQKLTPEQVEAGWDYAFKGTDTTVTTGSAKVTYSLDVIKDTYVLEDVSSVGADLRITVTFHDLYQGDKKHESTYTFAPTTAGYQLTVNTYKGETYSMAWTPIENVDEVMTYGDNKEYEQGQVVTIVNAGTAQDPAGTMYTLTLTPVKFATVKNETAIPLTVIYAGKEIDTAADATNEKGIVVADEQTLKLESLGKEISSWTAELKKATGTTTIHGSGSSSIENVAIAEGDVLTIKTIRYVNIVYLVTVQPTHHTTLTNYDQAGYYGREMVAYEQINEEGYKISGVVYDYEIDGVKYTGEAVKKTTDKGQEYWYYTMPAADITLRPVEEQEEYTVTFVDQNDKELKTFDVAPRTAFLQDVSILGATATAAVINPNVSDFKFNEEAQTVSFTMPADNVVVKITYETLDYSEDVAVAITAAADGLRITVVALDGKNVMPGTITLTCTVWEYDEDLEFWYPVEYDVPAEVEGDSIVTGCTISFDKIPMGTAYVEAVYESFAADGDSGMIVYI